MNPMSNPCDIRVSVWQADRLTDRVGRTQAQAQAQAQANTPVSPDPPTYAFEDGYQIQQTAAVRLIAALFLFAEWEDMREVYHTHCDLGGVIQQVQLLLHGGARPREHFSILLVAPASPLHIPTLIMRLLRPLDIGCRRVLVAERKTSDPLVSQA